MFYKCSCDSCGSTINITAKSLKKVQCSNCGQNMTGIVKTFNGKQLAEFRKSHAHSQAEFAQLLDVDRSYVSKLENNVYPISDQVINRLEDLFDLAS